MSIKASIKVDLAEMKREIRRAWRTGLNWVLNAKRGGWALDSAATEHARVAKGQPHTGWH